MVAASGPALRRWRVGQGHVSRTAHCLGTCGQVFGQCYQSVTLQREDQVSQYVAGEERGKSSRGVARFPVCNQGSATRHRGPKEVSARVRVRDEPAFGNCEDGRMTRLQLAGLIERMGNDNTLPGIRQRLGDSFEQGGVTTSEEYHTLSLGRGADSVKGGKRLTVDFENLVSRSKT